MPEVISDADQAEAEVLLLKAKSKSTYLERFNDEDVAHMASYLSVLSFSENEHILKKGEIASWVGIILSGELAAYVDGKVVGTMGTGTIVGEMAFFNGGERLADVDGSVSGFIALMMTSHLLELLKAAPETGCKLIRTLGTSALSQLAYSPSQQALQWAGSMGEESDSLGKDEVQQWAAEAFAEADGLEKGDVAAFCECTRSRRFTSGEQLINRFSATRDTICFITSGTVELRFNGAKVRTLGAGAMLHDLRFFEASLLPYDVVGVSDGVIAGIESASIGSLASTSPAVVLGFLRLLGSHAVEQVLEGLLSKAVLPPADLAAETSPQPAKRRSSVMQGSKKGALQKALAKKRSSETSASAEIFYLARVQRQRKEAEQATQQAADRGAAAEEAAHEAANSKILEAKAQRKTAALQSKLKDVDAEKQVAQREIRNLRVQLHSYKESEDKMAKIAHEAKMAAERADKALQAERLERDSMREELQALRSGDPSYHRALDAEAALEKCSKELEEERVRAATEAEAAKVLRGQCGELERLLDDERKRSKMQAVEMDQVETSRLRKALTAAADELRSTTKAKDEATLSERRLAEEASKTQSELLSRSEALEAERDGLRIQIRQQRLAAKALGLLYLTKKYKLRRQLTTAQDRIEELAREVSEAPSLRAAIEQQNEQLKLEAEEALAAVEPLKAERLRDRLELRQVSAKAEQLESTQDRLSALKKSNGELRTANADLLEHVRFLTTSLNETQSRVDGTRSQLEEAAASHARQLARRDQERRGLEMQLSEVISRVREHEKGIMGEQPSWVRASVRSDATSVPRAVTPRGGVSGVALPTVHAAALPVPRVLGRRFESFENSPREGVSDGPVGAAKSSAGKHSPRRPQVPQRLAQVAVARKSSE